MDFIIREFIPEVFTPTGNFSKKKLYCFLVFSYSCIEVGRVYGHLIPEAMKFCRVLASQGSTLAFNLINRYGLDQRLRNHLVAAVK